MGSKTDLPRLEKFVMDQAMDRDLALRALDLIKPFFTDADAGIYPLAVKDYVDAASARDAIAGAVGAPISALIAVSASATPGEDEDLMPPSGMIKGLPMFFLENQRPLLAKLLGEELFEQLVLTQYECLGEAIVQNLQQYHAALFGQLDQNMVLTLPFMPQVPIFYLLGYAIAGDGDSVDRLEPLIKLLPHAIPVGEYLEQPGEWLLLMG